MKAGSVKANDQILWFDGRTGKMEPFVVLEVRPRPNDRVGIRGVRYGKRMDWYGSVFAEIGVPEEEEIDLR